MSEDVTNQDPAPPRRKLPLTSWVTLAFTFLFLVTGGLHHYKQHQFPDWIAEFGSYAGAGLFFALFVAWLISKMTRSSTVPAVAFCLILVAQISGLQQQNREIEQTLATFEEEAREKNIALMEKALAGEDTESDMVTHIGRTASQMNYLAQTTTGEDAKSLQILSETIAEISPAVQIYYAALQDVIDSGGVDASSLKNRDQITLRLEKIDVFEQANEQFDALYASLPDQLRKKFKSEGIIGKDAYKIADSWENEVLPVVRKTRQADRELVHAMRGLLTVLSDHWGRWEVDSVTGEIWFEEDDTVALYNNYFQKMNHAATEQEALQRQHLDALKNR